MGRRHRRAARIKTASQDHRSTNHRLNLPRIVGADRRALLTGTALASTLLIAVMIAPTPAHAVVNCQTGAPAAPFPIFNSENDSIICVNTEARNNPPEDFAIDLQTLGDNQYIDLNNSGTLTTSSGANAFGISTETVGENGDIDIVNSGDVTATSTDDTYGIYARTNDDGSGIDIFNSGDITAIAADAATSIQGISNGAYGDVTIVNHGDLTATSTAFTRFTIGLYAETHGYNSDLDITNTGDIDIFAARHGYGIYAETTYGDSALDISNSGNISVTATGLGYGIQGITRENTSPIAITNSGNISVTAGDQVYGISAYAYDSDSLISINNSGGITVTSTGAGNPARGISAYAYNGDSPITITNTGDIRVTNLNGGAGGEFGTIGIYANAYFRDSAVIIDNSGAINLTGGDFTAGIYAYGGFFGGGGDDSPISITNSGAITATGADIVSGIFARTFGLRNTIAIVNSGQISVVGGGDASGINASSDYFGSAISINNTGAISAISAAGEAIGLSASAEEANSPISIVNSGNITAKAGGDVAFGIRASADDANSPISIVNSGRITVEGAVDAVGILALANGGDAVSIVNSGDITGMAGTGRGGGIAVLAPTSTVQIENSGSLYGSYAGIFLQGGTVKTIVNSGTIASADDRAIFSTGTGQTRIFNSGTITGFVDLADEDDSFTNQSGGVFEAKMTSLFGDGDDVFRNQSGGTVLALRDGSAAPSFEGLERFENKGLISTVDGATGDHFTISNTVGGKDLDFVASGNSRLAVDASLGGPGSGTDTFTIEGNVSGTTKVTINNTNTVGGEFNPAGIKIVTVTGATPNANAFTLDAPVDAGFFDYDLFFTPTGSGFWSLKSAPGAGAHMLPQLVTAAQDMWHQGSSTWFDRTADLRVLVNGGGAPAENYGAAQNDGISPAVWVRGSGGWLDRDGSGSTSANGRNYKFDLDRQLDTMDFQMGLDLGSRDLLSQGDALVFGLLGGFVHGDLDYDNINRDFDFDGGQVGVYATYMKGGLFVDTLLNVHIMELDANGALGFPNNDLDATTVGLRSDAGYRFGSFSGGAFLEPLATLEVTWADIDGFSAGGNSVKFDDDANVRGRLGLRAGTTMEAWDGTMMEPFVTGSLWGNLSGENQATLTSNGSSFRFEDDIDDVWGELSAGVNFFNFSQTTSVFAKVDVTLGDDVTGLGGKAGMRVAW